MWTAILALSALTLSLQDEAGQDPVRPPLRPASWLLIDGLDDRGRRPLRPDAVFAAHLLDPGADAPVEGQQLTGERGSGTWAYSPGRGNGGPEGRGGYAWSQLELAPEDAGVYLAKLSGAWQLFVNGRPQVGDAYRYGFGGVPVELVAGTNQIVVTGARGGFGLEFVRPEGELAIEGRDLTWPDVVVGETGAIDVGLCLHRTASEPLVGARVEVEGAFEGAATLEPIAPLETRVVALVLRPRVAKAVAGPCKLSSELVVRAGDGRVLARQALELGVVEPEQKRLRSFRSSIDHSTQVWGEVPPLPVEPGPEPSTGAPPEPGLVLSLHGASVAPRSQIGAYAAHPGLWIVAPTNRRPYGFDWQDWGRQDAYEVRDRFVARTPVSDTRRYLTGHSMGGHGAWHLAANDPDQWAVVAPSAGWRSFDTYGGRPDGTLSEWWHRADAASSTEAAIDNLRQIPTFVLHGDADETVSVDEARAMVALLEANDPVDVRSHFQPGAGHWWDGDPAPGTACVQWPALFSMFEEYQLPATDPALLEILGEVEPLELDFRTVDPAVDSRHHWLAVLEARVIGRPCEVRAAFTPGTGGSPSALSVTTDNVARLRLDPAAVPGGELSIDGQTMALDSEQDRAGAFELAFRAGAWRVAVESVSFGRRRPERTGPFKRAFDNGFVLVRGTAGDRDETAALLDLARYHATEWWYRANGRALLLTDVEFLGRSDLAHRNVILYGNRDTNAAWDAALEPDCPIQARRGGIQFGELFLRGPDRAALFVHRRRDSARALVGVFADAGARASRLHLTAAPFVSGVGIPDYLVFDSSVLTEGDDAAILTGFWDHDWRLDETNQTGF